MTLIEAVRAWIGTCPLVEGEKLLVDFLPAEAASYSVDVVPVTPVVRRYLDGSSIRQFLFIVATRTWYGNLVRQQIDNLAFFEDLADWIADQDNEKNYPNLGPGRQARSLEITTSGYVFAPGTETARYQIQCRLEYFQEGARKT